uniref:Protein kinase domain-containing protein n=1 Tax=Fagus sylvatica TaxID=28930 RepID=A0A2N9I4C2_FAGSY
MKREAGASDFGDGETWVRGPFIGKGSFGSVFLANSKKPNSRFQCFPSVMAVKSAEVSISASLQKEKEVHNNVQGCPNVIHCFGEDITFSAQQNGEMVYNLLLEYASGGTLSDLINNSGLLPESDVKRYTKSILRGLTHIHNCGYVHCDLKPENVLLVPNSRGNFVAKIGDLGLAKRSGLRKKRLDLRDYLRGTALYMAPETVIENVQDPPSDIWALGCVVCEMLTGKSPWDSVEELHTEDLLQFTAEMLMVHPFLADVYEPCYDEELLPDVPGSSWSETDSEHSGSFFSDNWSLLSDDDSASCSCSEDFEVRFVMSTNDEVSVVGQKRKRVTFDDNHKFRTAAAAQASLKFPASTILIGA